MPRHVHDLTDRSFSALQVIGRSPDHGNGKKPVTKWICRCKCGRVVTVKADSLLSGHTKSCGCLKRKHGYADSERLYETWRNMRRRCSDKRNNRWKQYGGKGVVVCPEWNEYLAFRSWAMANGYAENLTIDRIDVNGNYCPQNCRWADRLTQANNTTRNRWIEYQGRRFTMAEFARYLGLSYSALQHRIERGWSLVRTVHQPPRR